MIGRTRPSRDHPVRDEPPGHFPGGLHPGRNPRSCRPHGHLRRCDPDAHGPVPRHGSASTCRTGDRHACELALAEAAPHLDRRNDGDEPEWITYFDEAELAAEAAHCFRDANSARQPVEHARNAMSGSHVRSDFFATMELAGAYLRAGELEEACRVTLDALDLGEQLRSARCVSYLAEFRIALAPHSKSGAVRDLVEQAGEHRLWLAAGARSE